MSGQCQTEGAGMSRLIEPLKAALISNEDELHVPVGMVGPRWAAARKVGGLCEVKKTPRNLGQDMALRVTHDLGTMRVGVPPRQDTHSQEWSGLAGTCESMLDRAQHVARGILGVKLHGARPATGERIHTSAENTVAGMGAKVRRGGGIYI